MHRRKFLVGSGTVAGSGSLALGVDTASAQPEPEISRVVKGIGVDGISPNFLDNDWDEYADGECNIISRSTFLDVLTADERDFLRSLTGLTANTIYYIDLTQGVVLSQGFFEPFPLSDWREIHSEPGFEDTPEREYQVIANVYSGIEMEDPPEASITFSDQESDGTNVVIDQVELSNGGYVEITDEDGTVGGRSATLEAGTFENVEITISPALKAGTHELTATVYQPDGMPYLEDGEPVSDTALITVVEPVVPTASITFSNQESDGTSVVIQQVELSEGGFVEITDADGRARGRTADLEAETYENLEVALTPRLRETQRLTATVYRDIDTPYLEDGEPVSNTALITVRPDEKPPKKKKLLEKKRAVKQTKYEYKKAKKKCQKGRLTKKELKKKREAYKRAKREYEQYKKRCK